MDKYPVKCVICTSNCESSEFRSDGEESAQFPNTRDVNYKVLLKYLLNVNCQNSLMSQDELYYNLLEIIGLNTDSNNVESSLDEERQQAKCCMLCNQLAEKLTSLRLELESIQLKIADTVKSARNRIIGNGDDSLKQQVGNPMSDNYTNVLQQFQDYIANNDNFKATLEPDLWVTHTPEYDEIHLEVKCEPEDVDFDEDQDNQNYSYEEPLDDDWGTASAKQEDQDSQSDFELNSGFSLGQKSTKAITPENPENTCKRSIRNAAAVALLEIVKKKPRKKYRRRESGPSIKKSQQKKLSNKTLAQNSLIPGAGTPPTFKTLITGRIRRCQLCPFESKTLSTIESHLRQHHETDTKFFQCIDCNIQFTTQHLYWVHMRHHITNVKCDVCNESTNMLKLKSHIETQHGKVFSCNACAMVYGNILNHLQHTRQHFGVITTFPCGLCSDADKSSEQFKLRSNLSEHVYQVHGLTDPNHFYKCAEPFCSKVCFSKKSFDDHMTTHSPRDFVCTDCDSTFGTRARLDNHILNVHTKEAKYECDECAESFVYSHQLGRHKIVAHGTEKFKCDLCDQEFICKFRLKTHQRSQHGIGIKNETFTCPTCLEVFTQRQRFNRHKHRHLAEAPDAVSHVCEKCGYSSKVKGLLKRHIATVHVDKIQCPHCPKMLSKKYFKDHIRVHSKERPFVCEICGASYTQRCALNIHTKNQHPDQRKNHNIF